MPDRADGFGTEQTRTAVIEFAFGPSIGRAVRRNLEAK